MMSFGSVTPPVGRRRDTVSPSNYVIDWMPYGLESGTSRIDLASSVSNGSLHCMSQAIGFLKWFSSPAARMSWHSLVAPRAIVTWDDVLSATPDILIVMPCGFSITQTHTELLRMRQQPDQWSLASNLAQRTFLVDASSYFSRPGPRLIDGIELLAAILHPSDHEHIHESMACRLGPLPIHQHP